jgi:hypothetical protein
MRPLPAVPVFTLDEAASLGWTQSALRHAVASGHILRLRRGYYTAARDLPSGPIPPDLAAIAAARNYPRSVISHRSAVLIRDLPLLGPRPRLAEITVPPRWSGNAPNVHLHRARVRPIDETMVGPARATSMARTIVDLARHHPLRTAVVTADAALNRGLVTPAQIDDVIRDCWNWPRIRRAHRVVELMDGRSESPLESISRLVMPHIGVPAPELQAHIFDENDLFIARTDFYWDEFGVVGEADGRSKYADLEVVWDEKERQEHLADAGLVVVRWGWAEADRYPQQLEAKIRTAFARGQRRDRSGLPRLWTLRAQPDDANRGKRDREATLTQENVIDR